MAIQSLAMEEHRGKRKKKIHGGGSGTHETDQVQRRVKAFAGVFSEEVNGKETGVTGSGMAGATVQTRPPP